LRKKSAATLNSSFIIKADEKQRQKIQWAKVGKLGKIPFWTDAADALFRFKVYQIAGITGMAT